LEKEDASDNVDTSDSASKAESPMSSRSEAAVASATKKKILKDKGKV
jgi:hypothetical protein